MIHFILCGYRYTAACRSVVQGVSQEGAQNLPGHLFVCQGAWQALLLCERERQLAGSRQGGAVADKLPGQTVQVERDRIEWRITLIKPGEVQ